MEFFSLLIAYLFYRVIRHLFERIGWVQPSVKHSGWIEPTVKQSIFISYRRIDEPHLAHRVYERLAPKFGKKNVFIDVDSIPPGADWKKVLERSISKCGAMVVIIGRNWLDAQDAQGRRRIDDPQDVVRLEIETALRQHVAVFLVLGEEMSTPIWDEFPNSLATLRLCPSFAGSLSDFDQEVERLIKLLKGVLAPNFSNSRRPAHIATYLAKPGIWEATPPEVRDFLMLLHRQGVQIGLSANRKAIKFYGEPMLAENVGTYQRLEGQILKWLTALDAESE